MTRDELQSAFEREGHPNLLPYFEREMSSPAALFEIMPDGYAEEVREACAEHGPGKPMVVLSPTGIELAEILGAYLRETKNFRTREGS